MSAPDLSSDFYDAWVDAMRRLGLDPLDVARVAFAETGMYQRHPRNPAIGIWPFITSTLHRMGWTGSAEDFTALSPEDQIPWIERYLQPYGALDNDGLVYVVTFLPARLAAARAGGDDYVLTSQGDGTGFYESNAVLDRNRDGQITVGDLRTHLDIQDRGARWESIKAELEYRGAYGTPRKTKKAGPILVAVVGAGVLAWGLWELSQLSRSRGYAYRG